jgi:hypothetical protein
MATSIAQTTVSSERPRPFTILRRSWALNAPPTLLGLLMVGALLAALVGLVVDPRVITGAPVWLKPVKFAISVALYSFTFVYLLQFVRGHRRLVAFAANVMALALLVEVAILVGQVIRGTTSHFNYSTPLDATLFQIMGGFIIPMWTMALILGVVLLFQRMTDPVWAWALRLNVLLALVGMSLAFLMTKPTAAQLAEAQEGKELYGVTQDSPENRAERRLATDALSDRARHFHPRRRAMPRNNCCRTGACPNASTSIPH